MNRIFDTADFLCATVIVALLQVVIVVQALHYAVGRGWL